MGCSSTPESEENKDNSVEISGTYIVEIGPLDGLVRWNWNAKDMDYCARHTIDFIIYEISNSGQAWFRTPIYINNTICQDDGSFEASAETQQDVDDKRVFYDFIWEAEGVTIEYEITPNNA